MGGCAGTHTPAGVDGLALEGRAPRGPLTASGQRPRVAFTGLLCAVDQSEDQKAPVECTGSEDAATSSDEEEMETASEASRGVLALSPGASEEPPMPKEEVYVGIPEFKAEDKAAPVSGVILGVAEETGAKEQIVAKTLLQDLGRAAQNHDAKLPTALHGGIKLPILGRSRNGDTQLPIPSRAAREQECATPTLPIRARSAPVMLPAAAVRSRSLPRPELDLSSSSPTAAVMLPDKKSPTTALALSRRRKRRSVTFGEAECKEFLVDTSDAAAVSLDGPAA